MDEMQLQIKQYHKKKDESEGLVMAVKVTNLPPKIRKLQVELFFENPKKSGSGNEDLEKVDYDEAANCAIVWFKESEGQCRKFQLKSFKNAGIKHYFIFI